MEVQIVNTELQSPDVVTELQQGADSSFILANTVPSTLEEIRTKHIIPVFAKDNEPLISHGDFIESVAEAADRFFKGETILSPRIRLSHPIKGRIPEAKDKPAHSLLEREKTLYYERMAFVIEIPSISDDVEGNRLSLMVGGVKSYSLDNLYAKKGGDEHFKIFIGFQNKVCTNLCVWSDGYVGDLKVRSLGMLKASIKTLIEAYDQSHHLYHLKQLGQFSLSERQFASLIGRCRMYQHLPNEQKSHIPPLLFGESQISSVCRDYYRDESFCRSENGDINLWKLYNLFTGANKGTYIDQFMTRGIGAYEFVEQVKWGLEGRAQNWFLN